MGRRVLRTKLCDMLEIEYPILCAGMGPTLMGEKTGSPVELVVAVSEAGGLGVLGGSGFTVDELRDCHSGDQNKDRQTIRCGYSSPKQSGRF